MQDHKSSGYFQTAVYVQSLGEGRFANGGNSTFKATVTWRGPLCEWRKLDF